MLRTLALAALILGLATLGPAPTATAAPLCAYDASSHSLAVTNLGAGITFTNADDWLAVNDVSCAAFSIIDSVTVDMASGNDLLIFDLRFGALGPGMTDEGNGSSEVEFSVTNLADTTSMMIFGDDATGIALGSRNLLDVIQTQVNLDTFLDGGTPDVDIVTGGIFANVQILTGSGADSITGAGTGTVLSESYPGSMYIQPGLGADTVTGGSGDDTVKTKMLDGADVFRGGAGTDTFDTQGTTADGPQQISLDDVANDGVCPSATTCSDDVGSDFEQVFGSADYDHIVGGPGTQWLWGADGPDILEGGLGADHLDGGDAGDSLKGGGGRDLLIGGRGSDSFEGGPGFDTVSYRTAEGGVSVTINDQPDDEGFDNVHTSVEELIGSPFPDLLIGSDLHNVIHGGLGPDTIRGRGGPDELYGQAGNDTIAGGDGKDRCRQGPGSGAITDCEV